VADSAQRLGPESENKIDTKRNWIISWTVDVQAAETTKTSHRRWAEMHFPRSEMRIDPRKKGKQTEKEQPQRGRNPNKTNTSLAAMAAMGATDAHTTASKINQQKMVEFNFNSTKIAQRSCAGERVSGLYTVLSAIPW
jgi:hypothetical protein